MSKILVVEDDEAMRKLIRRHLENLYEIIDTGDAREGLALALHEKPDVIFLDLMIPDYSGFELCQTLSSLTYTQLIPVFVISAKPVAEYKAYCLGLGAREYFQKPLDFDDLKSRLETALQTKRVNSRKEARVKLRVILTLKGIDENGTGFEQLSTTDDVSASGFLCDSSVLLRKDSIVEVSLGSGGGHYVGPARVIRTASSPPGTQPRYGFRFVEKPHNWVLR